MIENVVFFLQKLFLVSLVQKIEDWLFYNHKKGIARMDTPKYGETLRDT